MEDPYTYSLFQKLPSLIQERFKGTAVESQTLLEYLSHDYELLSTIFTLMALGVGLLLAYKLIHSTILLVWRVIKICLFTALTGFFLYWILELDCQHFNGQLKLLVQEKVFEYSDWLLPWK
ncbi:hypothetical protein K7432_013206 [Basidiobolus ranarum]|uniref:Uncharacterized protein n=1 Tax=Basidiobolus ranarum TaxID=34480 RepID=A0ABR2VR68_9FUNG